VRNALLVVLILSLAAAFACSRGGSMQAPSPEADGGFSLVNLRDGSALPLDLAASPSAGGVDLTVSTRGEVRADEFLFGIVYDATRYTPGAVTFAGALGESVDLAVTDRPGRVDIGTSRIRNAGDPVGTASGVVARAHFEGRAYAGRSVSGLAPTSPDNKVTNLAAIIVDGQATLTWTERNVGDYDNNGEVGVADITPIALNFGVASGQILSLVDGDKNGEIGVSDITQIALNFQNAIAGYKVNVLRGTSWAMIPNESNPGSPYTVDRPAVVPGDRPVTYTVNYTLAPEDEESFSTAPVGPDGSVGIISNIAGTGGGPVPVDPPAKVTGLTAQGDQSFGEGVIRVSWTGLDPSTVDHYKLWWQVGGDGSNLVACPGFENIANDVTSVDIGDCAKGVTHHFAIWAINYSATQMEQHGPLSDIVNAQAWYDVPPIPALEITDKLQTRDITITNDAGSAQTITLNPATTLYYGSPSDTINLSVKTNLDAEYPSELAYTWAITAGSGTFGGNTASSAVTLTPSAANHITATCTVDVPATSDQQVATFEIIVTTTKALLDKNGRVGYFPAFVEKSLLSGNDTPYEPWRQGKVTWFNFWGDTCGWCHVEMPGLILLHDTYQSQGYQGLGFVPNGLFNPGGYNSAKAWLDGHPEEKFEENWWDDDNYAASSGTFYKIKELFANQGTGNFLPQSYLIDRDGIPRWFVPGSILGASDPPEVALEEWGPRIEDLLN